MHQEQVPLRILDAVMERWGRFVSYGVLLLMGVTVYEVMLRYIFNRPTIWAHETASMLLVCIVLGSGFTLCHRTFPRHIKMDVFYTRFSPRKRAIVEVVGSITFFIYIGVMLWYGGQVAWRSLQLMEHSATVWGPPVYPLKLVAVAGVFLFLVMGVAHFIRNLTTAITGKETS